MTPPVSLASKPASLREEAMRIGGERVRRPRVIEVMNPYTGALVGTVPKATVEDVRRAFSVAAGYQATLMRSERAEILRRTADLLVARKEEISDLITAESGLCKKDTLYEVGRAYDVFLLSAQLTLLDDSPDLLLRHHAPRQAAAHPHAQREPLRAISAITPFNHPLNQVAHKVAPSIATNNKMVLKPSEKTPLTALLLADVLYEAGLPPQMFQVVTGDPREIADELHHQSRRGARSPSPAASAPASISPSIWAIAAACWSSAATIPSSSWRMPISRRRRPLPRAGSYKNSGQRCTAVKRILVHQAVADRFIDLLVAKTQAVKYGDPMDPKTDMGTVIDEEAATRIERRVDDAISRGARLLHGHKRQGALYAPTVLDNVPADCELVREETFGPVSPVLRFNDIDEAIRLSNSTAYGLSSGVCTNRLDYITRFVRDLKVGTVNVREVPGYRIEMSPFGGIKDSGLGYKEGVLEAMKSFTNVKTYSVPWL